MEQHILLRKLRTDRKLSQSFLAKGITTREAITRFEHRGSHIASTTLFLFLEKMNISPEEYYFLLNDCKLTEKQQIDLEGIAYLNRPNEQAAYLKRLETAFFSSSDPFYSLIKAQYKLLYAKFNDSTEQLLDCEKDRQTIITYLNRIEDWGRFELSLFSNLLFIFESSYIIDTFKVTIKKCGCILNIPLIKRAFLFL